MIKTNCTTYRVNEKRLFKQFEALSTIGATKDGGVHRPALSEPHLQARHWFINTAKEAGLSTKIDGAGNHSAFLYSSKNQTIFFLIGSHLDSVPNGGRFDGALGIVAALEVLQVIKENKIPLRCHIQVTDFTDEEGHFVGLMGSQAIAGLLSETHLQHTGEREKTFTKALANADLNKSSILASKVNPETIAGYLELHIEQGVRLVDQHIDIGIVTSIVGIRSFMVTFIGRSDHAGTTGMDQRLDPTPAASQFAIDCRETVMKKFPGSVATIGNMTFQPGAFNVIPERITVFLEFRSDNHHTLDQIEGAFWGRAEELSRNHGLKLQIRACENVKPVNMTSHFQQAITDTCQALGLASIPIPSGAGHDAQSLAQICPCGMIFVPSVDGHSHSARESTNWNDCVNGANVLLQTTLRLTMDDNKF